MRLARLGGTSAAGGLHVYEIMGDHPITFGGV